MKTVYALAFILCLIGRLLASDTTSKLPPPPPAGVAAKSGGDSEAALSWEASQGATGYIVYRSTVQNDVNARQAASDIAGTSFTATQLKNNTTYYFKVKAVGLGGTSGFSQEVTATTAITKQLLPNGVYTLAPRNAPGLRLQVDDVAKMTVGRESASLSQQWTLSNLDQTTYRLSPVNSPARKDESWILTPASGGYRLTRVNTPELALTASSAADGSPVSPRTATRSDAQIWNILPVSESAPDPGAAYVPAGYKLVFSDEFDGSTVDTTQWETLAPFSQPHLNDEIECYQPEGVSVADGMCILRAEEMATPCGGKYTWRSGAITSKATRSHGYYEARVKVPQGQGLWPAFWLTSSKRWPPEWDIMEIPNTVGTLYQYMHPTKGTKITWVKGIEGSDSIYSTVEGMPNPYSGFVIYGCESTPDGIKLWINGKLTAQWAVSADTDDPMWVSLNLAVGGKWPGAPDVTTPRPANMYIDYVRVYQ